MNKPEFTDIYVTKFIIENGSCYTVKKTAEMALKNKYQKVIFAIELKDKILMDIKNLTTGELLTLKTTKKRDELQIKEDMIITTTADSFKNMDFFLNFYELTEVSIKDFLENYLKVQESKNKNLALIKKRPTRKNI